jgi:hypothetical protein
MTVPRCRESAFWIVTSTLRRVNIPATKNRLTSPFGSKFRSMAMIDRHKL